MIGEKRSIQFGAHDIAFSVVRRDRRTLQIAVQPDASIVVTAPVGTDAERIDARVRKRAAWILRQQRYFQAFLPRTPARRFVAGETHRYLGRHYRLRVARDGSGTVKLFRGFLVVDLPRGGADADVQQMVERWFHDRARLKFVERLEVCLSNFASVDTYRPLGLIIRRLERRWGSMSPGGRLLLNERLVHARMECIDYVITHELCHRVEAHHGPAFFNLLSRVMPDWPKRKESLERSMA